MPHHVREGLFIGDINDAAEILQRRRRGTEVTHLLSLLSSASISFFSDWRPGLCIPTREVREVSIGVEENRKVVGVVEMAGLELELVRMGVRLRDTDGEDLLDCLDLCLDFIDQSRKEGSILVHCFAGVSRSAAVVTAYLMRTEQLSQEDALESLRQSCEFVCPNEGFLDQLKMFQDMGFKVDYASSIYKCFRLKKLGDLFSKGEKIESSKFGSDPGLSTETGTCEEYSKAENKTIPAHHCRKCHRVIALQENVIGHGTDDSDSSFGWQRQRSSGSCNQSDGPECSSLFVEPLRWMTTVEEGASEGKLICANCEAVLGSFNWWGFQCSCGAWVCPAFQLHKSRIDFSSS